MNVEVYANGFIKVGDYYVQGMQNVMRSHGDPANASRPSCSCPKGFTELQRDWCDHKKVAYEYLKTEGKSA
jgi:hypothetical protein